MVRAAALFYPRAQRSPGARRGPRPWATPRGEAAWALRSRRRRWGASARVHSIGPRPLGGGEGPSVPLWGPRQAAGFPPTGSASAGEMRRSLTATGYIERIFAYLYQRQRPCHRACQLYRPLRHADTANTCTSTFHTAIPTAHLVLYPRSRAVARESRPEVHST